MSRILRAILSACLAGLIAHSNANSGDKKKEAEPKAVNVNIGKETENRGPRILKKITRVEYAVLETNPPTLKLKAWGEVPTAGWTAKLERVSYYVPPKDGIQDFILMGSQPSEAGATVISQAMGEHEWKKFRQDAPWIKGFRIHGVDEGVVEVRFDKR